MEEMRRTSNKDLSHVSSVKMSLRRMSSMVPKLKSKSNSNIKLPRQNVSNPSTPFSNSVNDKNILFDEDDDKDDNDLYLSELKDIEKAKKLNVYDFVSIVCHIIYIV